MTVKRRSKECKGMVNFPISPIKDGLRVCEYESTNEGGMMVELVVVPSEASLALTPKNQLVYTSFNNVLLQDDKRDKVFSVPEPEPGPDGKWMLWLEADQKFRDDYDAFHFPQVNSSGVDISADTRYRSRPYLAVAEMGVTGWSGYSDEKGYWSCGYENLNEEGKKIYNELLAKYPDATLHLLTWLDT